jgi:hypothetical protein
MPKRKKKPINEDRRRKHHQWQVTLFYADGEKFARVYINLDRAKRSAERQKKSPIVVRTRIRRLV